MDKIWNENSSKSEVPL